MKSHKLRERIFQMNVTKTEEHLSHRTFTYSSSTFGLVKYHIDALRCPMAQNTTQSNWPFVSDPNHTAPKMMIALPLSRLPFVWMMIFNGKKTDLKKRCDKKERLCWVTKKKMRPFRFGFGVNHRWVRSHVFFGPSQVCVCDSSDILFYFFSLCDFRFLSLVSHRNIIYIAYVRDRHFQLHFKWLSFCFVSLAWLFNFKYANHKSSTQFFNLLGIANSDAMCPVSLIHQPFEWQTKKHEQKIATKNSNGSCKKSIDTCFNTRWHANASAR